MLDYACQVIWRHSAYEDKIVMICKISQDGTKMDGQAEKQTN